MFRKRRDAPTTDRPVTTDSTVTATDGGPPSAARRGWYDPARGMTTLIAVAAAGLLVWLATQIDGKTTGGYWGEYGILAGAGLVLALSQLLGGWTKFGMPRLSPSVFLLAFIPTLIVVGWIAIFHQPHGNWWRGHIVGWSGDLSVAGFIQDMGEMLPVLSLGLGLVFGYTFDTTGTRRRAVARRETAVTRPTPVPADRAATDEPLTSERGVVTQQPEDSRLATTPAGYETPSPSPQRAEPEE